MGFNVCRSFGVFDSVGGKKRPEDGFKDQSSLTIDIAVELELELLLVGGDLLEDLARWNEEKDTKRAKKQKDEGSKSSNCNRNIYQYRKIENSGFPVNPL